MLPTCIRVTPIHTWSDIEWCALPKRRVPPYDILSPRYFSPSTALIQFGSIVYKLFLYRLPLSLFFSLLTSFRFPSFSSMQMTGLWLQPMSRYVLTMDG